MVVVESSIAASPQPVFANNVLDPALVLKATTLRSPHLPHAYLSVEIGSIDATSRQVSTTVENISGETLLVGSCVVDLQLREMRGSFRIPADAPACEYRLLAHAATAAP
jgi:hypothetical protein